MTSESGEPRPVTEPAPAKRPMARRRKKKLMFVIIVIAVAAVIVLWGWSATGAKDYLQVATLVDDSSGGSIPAKYLNRTVEVQGVVVDWEGSGDMNFSLADKTNSLKTVEVELVGSLPAEFANGKTAVVKGDLDDTLPLRIIASEVTIGCASRY